MNEQERQLVEELEELTDEMMRDPYSQMAYLYAVRCTEILYMLPRATCSQDAVSRIEVIMDKITKSLEVIDDPN